MEQETTLSETKNLSDVWKDWPEEDRILFAQSIKFWTPKRNEITYNFIFVHLLQNAENQAKNEEQRKRFENCRRKNHSVNSNAEFCFDVSIGELKTPEPPNKSIEEIRNEINGFISAKEKV